MRIQANLSLLKNCAVKGVCLCPKYIQKFPKGPNHISIIKIRIGHSTITYILIKHLSIFKKYFVIYWIENKFYKNQNQLVCNLNGCIIHIRTVLVT